MVLSEQSEDFENAKILGFPRLTCSKKSLLLNFDTNIPFQGRISIVKKVGDSVCAQDFSSNIQRNATFTADLRQCMDVLYLNNGSRVFSAHIEIGFHPLVITSNDRLFNVKCIDNSYAVDNPLTKTLNSNCSHTVRLASRWESSTVFHVGDAVVHEWNCNFESKGGQKYQTFLTSCNAVSGSGQLIHLVDENGCIVDSELIGEVVYNNFIPKVFARARVFKLMNDDRYRIECQVQMCSSDGVCKDRLFPPKCAFTKEEILSRYTTKTKTDSYDDTFMTGTINNRYDKQVKVVSEWITVHNNQYTNIEQLQERFYLSAVMDEKMEEPKPQTTIHHFLMGISYRSPNHNERQRNQSELLETPLMTFSPTFGSFSPQNPTIGLDDIDDIAVTSAIETATTTESINGTTKSRNEWRSTTKGQISSPPRNPAPSYYYRKTTTKFRIVATTPSSRVIITTTEGSSSSPPTTTPTTKTSTKFSKEVTYTMVYNNKLTTKKFSIHPTVSPYRTTESTDQEQFLDNKAQEKPATLHFYNNRFNAYSTTPTPPKSSKEPPFPPIFASEMSVLENKIARLNASPESTTDQPSDTDQAIQSINENDINSIAKDKFANPRDWRLDDRTINDTDILPERQVSCSNATIIASQRKCSWSGLEHLLVVWSFASLLVWIVMIGACFYRQANKPSWVEFRERELQRVAQSRVLQHEHPWVHADAFEETRNKNKNELSMMQGTF
ncbi:hypothetical protein Q1695_001418 [Nippostrongylus brasiliensis]|nr:hypothetical protein Q1695_001418 [Nippostrongylus brasiliensis]